MKLLQQQPKGDSQKPNTPSQMKNIEAKTKCVPKSSSEILFLIQPTEFYVKMNSRCCGTAAVLQRNRNLFYS